jgi:hypothetical protein
MTGNRTTGLKMTRIGLGFRALRGGGVVVGITLKENEPRVMLSSFLRTANEGDRLALEPYHVAAELKRGPGGAPTAEARAAVAEGRKRQDALAAEGIAEIVRTMRSAEIEPAVAGLLVNRAGWVTDLLAFSLAFPDHPPVAEGLAVREAIRFGVKRAGLNLVELDEKSLTDLACERYRIGPGELNARLRSIGAAAGKPWRKEQKMASLAAWIALGSTS